MPYIISCLQFFVDVYDGERLSKCIWRATVEHKHINYIINKSQDPMLLHATIIIRLLNSNGKNPETVSIINLRLLPG